MSFQAPGEGGTYSNMLTVRVFASLMAGFLGPKFSKQESFSGRFYLKQGWVWLKIRQKLFKIDSFPSKFIIKVGPKARFGN